MTAHLGTDSCEICGEETQLRQVRAGLELQRCDRCPHARLVASTTPEVVYRRYQSADYFDFHGDSPAAVEAIKIASADKLLRHLEKHQTPGRLLEIGCAGGELLVAARRRGWTVNGVELCGPFAERANQRLGRGTVYHGPMEEAVGSHAAELAPNAVIFNDVLEHLPDPYQALETTHDLLAEDGLVLVNAPDLGSASARLMGRHWTHYKPEHLVYFSKPSLSRLMQRAGFSVVESSDTPKVLNPSYVAEHLRVYHPSAVTRWVQRTVASMPTALQQAAVPILTGNLLVIGRKRRAYA